MSSLVAAGEENRSPGREHAGHMAWHPQSNVPHSGTCCSVNTGDT